MMTPKLSAPSSPPVRRFPPGRAIAQALPPSKRLRLAIASASQSRLTWYEYARQNVVSGDLTAEQDDVLWQLAQDIYEQIFVLGKMNETTNLFRPD